LEAAHDLLSEQGYGAITMDAIAARAGVGRQTIYRWWPNKAAVVLEAVGNRTRRQVPHPDTGTLEGDLIAFLNGWVRGMRGSAGAALHGLLAESLIDSEFARAFREEYVPARRDTVRHLLLRGQDRGELSAKADLELISDLIFSPVWYRFVLGDLPKDAAFASKVVRTVLAGVVVDH
jgi:AcrR family transcriptional regulator